MASRDIRLLHWWLTYHVPVDQELTYDWLVKAREHCRMSPERFAAAQAGAGWQRMLDKRARRLAYHKEHGSVPDGWTPPAAGERDYSAQLDAMKRWREKVAPVLAQAKRNPEPLWDDLARHVQRYRRLSPGKRKNRLIDDAVARLSVILAAIAGDLTLQEFELCEHFMVKGKNDIYASPQ